MINKISLVSFITLLLIGCFGAWNIWDLYQNEYRESVEKKARIIVHPRAEGEIVGVVSLSNDDQLVNGKNNFTQNPIKENMEPARSIEKGKAEQLKLEDREVEEAFYEEQDRNKDDLYIQKLREAGDEHQKYLILSEAQGEALNSDPEMIERMRKLNAQGEKAQHLIPKILGIESENLTQERALQVAELRKKADAYEKYLPEIVD